MGQPISRRRMKMEEDCKTKKKKNKKLWGEANNPDSFFLQFFLWNQFSSFRLYKRSLNLLHIIFYIYILRLVLGSPRKNLWRDESRQWTGHWLDEKIMREERRILSFVGIGGMMEMIRVANANRKWIKLFDLISRKNPYLD